MAQLPEAWRTTVMNPVLIQHGSITEWGIKAEKHVPYVAADVQMLCEHHLKKHRIADKRAWLRTNSWRAEFTAAQETGDHVKAASGGVAILSRNTLDVTPQFCDGKYLAEGTIATRIWTAVGVRLKGCTVMLVEAYFDPGIGFTGTNYEQLVSICKELKAAGPPFIIASDWNDTADARATTGVLGWLGAEVFLPQGADYTCRNGRRIIDYVVCSVDLVPAVRVEADEAAHWAEHLAP